MYLFDFQTSLNTLIVGFCSFILCFFIQIFIWWISKIKYELFILLLIMGLGPILNIFIFNIYLYIDYNYLHSLILTYSFTMSYTLTYPAFKEDIPSVRILRIVKINQPIDEFNIIKIVNKKNNLINIKIEELCNDSLLICNNGNYHLTKFGNFVGYLFFHYRKYFNNKNSTG
jgi:hypothetical protein